MARKAIAIVLVSLFVFSFVTPAYCGDTTVKKLGRGVCNVLTSPFEISNQMSKVNQKDGPMAGITYGVLKGIMMIGVRAVVGVYEIATFPIPFPKGYQPILTDPEFFFEDMNW